MIGTGVAFEQEVIVVWEGVGGEGSGSDGVLVGVEEDSGVVVVAGAAVGVEGEDVGSGDCGCHSCFGFFGEWFVGYVAHADFGMFVL